MEFPRTRRVQRVHLAPPLLARLGATEAVLVDISILGGRIEHHVPLTAGAHAKLTFRWDEELVVVDCRIVRSRLERFSVGADGLTIYHSGLEFENLDQQTRKKLKEMVGRHITRALEEQKLNARGVIPGHDYDHMPIFRFGGQLTADAKDRGGGGSLLPMLRVAKETGYICYHLENERWRTKRTHDPGQPPEGFTISANEDRGQAALLCDAYQRSDIDGRRLIQLFAQLSIVEGEGIPPGRFEP